jgi:hypothetical protein
MVSWFTKAGERMLGLQPKEKGLGLQPKEKDKDIKS